MVKHLRGIVVQDFLADFLQVVACGAQLVEVADGNAVDVFHNQDVFAAQLGIHLRAGNIVDVFVRQREFLQIGRFSLEVGFLQERCPQFLDHIAHVKHLVVFHDARGLPRNDAHDVDVLRHGGANARPLDFHRNNAAVGQARLVHLRQRSAAKRR